jgi:hypothetical protein
MKIEVVKPAPIIASVIATSGAFKKYIKAAAIKLIKPSEMIEFNKFSKNTAAKAPTIINNMSM